MPSLLAQYAAARINSMQPTVEKRRPAVVRYSPGQVVPTARVQQQQQPQPQPMRQQPVGERATVAEQNRHGTDFSALEQAFAKAPQQGQPDPNQDQSLPWWMKAGGLLNAVLTPLGLMGTGRKAVEVGAGEFAQHAPQGLQSALAQIGATQTGTLGGLYMHQPLTQIANPAAYATNTQAGGFVDKERAKQAIGNPIGTILNPQSPLGFGNYLDPKNGQWTNRIIGLTGDVAMDPATYVNPIPSARLLAGGDKALAEAADASEVALRKAVSEGADAATIAGHTATRDAAVDALRQSQRSVPIHGRADRIKIISELAGRDPEAFAAYQDELTKGAQRGFNTMSPEARRVAGIADPGLYMPGGDRIPGTGQYAEKLSQLGGGIRAARDPISTRIPLLSKLASGPKGMETAYSVLSRGGKDATPENAAALVRGMYNIRQGQGRVRTGGNSFLRSLWHDTFKGNNSEANRKLLQEAELNAAPNEINDTLSNIRQLYEQVSGDTVPVLNNLPDQYVPHVLTPGAKRMLANNLQDPTVAALVDKMGFVKDDLLEGSGFLEKARQFKPNADGSPGVFNFPGGKQLVIERGDIGELNQKFKELLPGFKGPFYQDDPVHIIESYVDSLAKAAGGKKAVAGWLAEQGPTKGQVRTITGDLAEAFRQHGEHYATAWPEADLAKGGYDPAAFVKQTPIEGPTFSGRVMTGPEVVNPMPKRTPMPGQIGDINPEDFFQTTYAENATKERDRALLQQGPKYAAAARKDVKPVYQTIRQDLADLKTEMTDPLKAGAKEAEKKLPDLEVQVKQGRQELDRIFGSGLDYSTRSLNQGERGRVVNELSNWTAQNEQDINALEEVLRNKDRYFKGVLTKEQKQLVTRLEGSLRTLKDLRQQAQERIGDLPEQLRTEAQARHDFLMQPMRDLEDRVKAAQAEAARRVPAPTKERLDWALTTMAGNDDEARAVLRSQYEEARRLVADNPENRALIGPVEGGGLPRTKNGRLTAESRAAIEDARKTIAQHEGGGLEGATSQAARPRTQGHLVSPKYNADEQALYDARQRLEDTPLRNTRQRRTIQAEIDQLQRKFNPGGEHFAETHARAVLAEQADHEAAQAAAAAKFDPERTKLQGIIDNQVEWGANYGPRSQAIRPEGWSPPAGGRPSFEAPRTEKQAIQDLRNQAMVASTQSPEARTIRQTTPKIEATQARLSNIYAGEYDPERDIGLPLSVSQRKAATPVLDPATGEVMSAQDAVAFNKRRRILRDVVIEGTNERIKQLEQRGIGVQAKLVTDTQDVARLAAQRDSAAQLLPQLDAVKPKSVPKQELGSTLEDIAGVARANPNFSDADLNATESLLQSHREGLLLAGQKEMTANQVGRMVKMAQEGKLAPVMLTALNDNWKMMYKGVLKEGDTIVDAQLHQMFTNLTALDKQPKLFGRTFGSLTNLFKTYATLSPGFHVRNALSGIFMNTADGVGLKAQLEGAKLWHQYMKDGEKWLANQDQRVQDAFQAVVSTGAGGRFTESGVASVSSDLQNPTLRNIYDKAASNRLTRKSQEAGELVEGALRMGMALDSLDRGESLTGAIDRITRVHFDYGQISSFDKTMKQFIPFWTFMSRNLPLQISQMYTQPRAYQIYGSVVRNFQTKPEDYTPQYWLQAGAINTGLKVPDNNLPILGKASGLPIYIQPDLGMTRLSQDTADLTNILQNPAGVLSEGNPLLTSLLEYSTHHNLYTGQNYGPSDFEKVSGPFGIPANILSRIIPGNRNAQGEVSKNLLNVLRSVNPLADRQARLLPQASGGDPEAEKRQAESILRFLGAPVRTLTPKQQDSEFYRQYYDAKDQAKAEQAALLRQLQAQAS